ncbi:MAG: hypothetical protein ABIJ05_01895 [Patescibacteria group bacterium]
MIEQIRKIYYKEHPLKPEGEMSDWEKMKDELKNNFPNFDIEKFKEPIKDWFMIRTVLNFSKTTGEDFDLMEINRTFDLKYGHFADNEDVDKVLGYITTKLGKKAKPVERK